MPWQPINELAAAEQKLGTASADFTYSLKHFLWSLLGCAAGASVGLFLFYLAFQMAREGWALPVILIALGLGALAGSGYGVYLALPSRFLQVKIFPAGLLSIERDRFLVIYWGQVEAVWEELTIDEGDDPVSGSSKTHKYTVKMTDGVKAVFTDSIRDVAELGGIIEDETSRRLLPLALKKYNEGGEVVFGNWSVSEPGLKHHSKLIPWESIGKVEMWKGFLSVTQHGRILYSGGEKTAQVPNLFVLLALVDALRGDATSE
jgi:uncharacterized protein DUF6585